MKYLPTFIILATLIAQVHVLDNGLGLKPPMGWLSWGYYECSTNCSAADNDCLNEKLIMTTADHLVNDGFLDAGYEYVIIDDCWSEMERDEENRLVPDRRRFPRGMKFLAEYVHSKGLKFGMYTNIGEVTCKLYPGSAHHLMIDAQTFADWEVDFLKVDGCFVSYTDLNRDYIRLVEALNTTERPIFFACSWPYYVQYIHKQKPNYDEVTRYCNMFRTYHDIFPYWDNIAATTKYFEENIDLLKKYNGPGHWFDPDMLLAGQGLSLKKHYNIGHLRIQMAVFAMISAPFLISCPMKNMSLIEKDMLLNLDLIAISRDEGWKMATPWRQSNANSLTIWTKSHEPRRGDRNPACTFALVNYDKMVADALIAVDSFPACEPFANEYTVKDIFRKKYVRNITSSETFRIIVPAEDAVIYTMYPI